MLEIIYRDEHIVAVNKPHGLLVHQSPIARDAEEFALQILRDQIGQTVWPCHRLDRKTGGLLLFALDKETEINLQTQFQNGLVQKKYLAIVRGHTMERMTIDYPIAKDDGKLQDAVTHFRTLSLTEIDLPFGKHATSRYALIEAIPETGRMHQLRRHFAHILHPIIGDRPHGCNKQNKLFKEKWQMDTMMLHASELSFEHPFTKKKIHLQAIPQSEFSRTLQLLKFEIP
ncbi:tRNA pseudouridine synthase C [Pseudopedobacter saltans DSM 12145]|uniref:tRNA pseudouridine synthase C n=1 Tax=Pseudopedobacter saltans (strain ATCC 51119 / DSM 12145 / JCM 21818 / CCUG 39354 / LMG 10337 / NBRC 100064 / NCIMB 13643) TaxID=762903 RepID=F0S9D5_PSESL|nr:pseudouridine synthase [Pseudopedobacter saltans]ADY52485.1 tRNA pseudouridine synthase C [Pseudopedobacter saltans DSM 12145]